MYYNIFNVKIRHAWLYTVIEFGYFSHSTPTSHITNLRSLIIIPNTVPLDPV